MSMPEVIDSAGNKISTSTMLGKGGEGAVYLVARSSRTVAKIYHKPLDKERADKIATMTRIKTDALVRLTAWPTDLIRLKATGQPIGLLMKQVGGHNVHHLYGPKSRLQDFPAADWRFLVHAAANIARAFAVVHEAGCVIGDVNHGSVMVEQNSTVQLVDCDSFQIKSANGHFLCDKGVETFTPPELQGTGSFRGIVRTPNYDNFGLAVLIFHLLFMGRHPFAGRFTGAGDMPISRAIKEFRFPYSANRRAMQMEPPPGTPPLDYVGPAIARLFEAAFSQSGMTSGRPAARAWVGALADLEKTAIRCRTHPGHWYPSHAKSCPWCSMEALGGRSLFPYPLGNVASAAATVGSMDIEALWRELEKLPEFAPKPAAAGAQPKPSYTATSVKRPSKFLQNLPMFGGWAVGLIGTFLFPPAFYIWIAAGFGANAILTKLLAVPDHVAPFRATVSAAENALKVLDAEWALKGSDAAFTKAREQFLAARRHLTDLPKRRLATLDKLRADQRKLQLNRFLDRFELEDAKIDGIGPGRKRILESYGIETAEDCVPYRIKAVPGFGPKMIARLVKWREAIEKKFVFDPTRAIDPRDIAVVEQDILKQRSQSEAAAKSAYAEAIQAHAKISRERELMLPRLRAAQTESDQAKADLVHVSR